MVIQEILSFQMAPNKKRILVTFAGGRLANGVIRALRKMDESVHIIGTDSNEFYVHGSEADESHLVPRGDDPEYLPVLRDVISQTQPDMLWPLHEAEMIITAGTPDLGVKTFLPPHAVMALCQNKANAQERFAAAGVPAPESYAIANREDLKQAFKTLSGDIWLRAVSGTGGTGALATQDLKSAENWIDLNDGWGTFTAAERLSGTTYCWESIWKSGSLVASQVRTRLAHAVPGTPGGSAYARSIYKADAPDGVESAAKKAVLSVMDAPHGILSVDLTGDRHGVPKVTEINAGRFTSSGVLYWAKKGPNFAEIALRAAFDEEQSASLPLVNPMPRDQYMVMGINTPPYFISEEAYKAKVSDYEARCNRLGI